jgi:hypothetical protein
MKIDIRQSFATLDEPRHKYSSLVTCLLPLNPHEIEYQVKKHHRHFWQTRLTGEGRYN